MTGYKRYTPRTDPGWRDHALCQQFTTETFFPESKDHALALTAKRICHACPVEKRCLNFALSQSGLVGIFGGTTPKERSRMRVAASAVA